MCTVFDFAIFADHDILFFAGGDARVSCDEAFSSTLLARNESVILCNQIKKAAVGEKEDKEDEQFEEAAKKAQVVDAKQLSEEASEAVRMMGRTPVAANG